MKRLGILVMILLLTGCSSIIPGGNKEERNKEKIMSFYSSWKGVPYRLAGTNKSGVDCSALMQVLYREQFGINLPRTTKTQVKEGSRVFERNLKVGDLMFFKTGRNTRHVGVYIGDNKFMHASTSRGVMISEYSKYWKDRYWQSRRVL